MDYPLLKQVGIQRAALFSNEEHAGYTVSECVALEPPSLIVWKLMTSQDVL